MEKKICINCGKEYLPTYDKQQCCCKKCAAIIKAEKQKANRVLKHCEVCGNDMYVIPARINKKYCCRKCADIGRTTKVKKICEYCGKEFSVINKRDNTAKYCCRNCADKAKIAKPNCTCTQCGKEFYMKKYQQDSYNRNLGYFCSRDCVTEYKRKAYLGSGNHQYGLQGPLNASYHGDVIPQKNHKLIEQMVYCPEHPFCTNTGRVKQHRLIVEQNYKLFDIKYFIKINI